MNPLDIEDIVRRLDRGPSFVFVDVTEDEVRGLIGRLKARDARYEALMELYLEADLEGATEHGCPDQAATRESAEHEVDERLARQAGGAS